MSVYYLGAFPIEGGGVTLKNQYLFDSLKSRLKITKIDFNKISRKKNLCEFIKFVIVCINPFNKFCIGISTGKRTRRTFTKYLYFTNRISMRKSIIMIMGGTAADEIVNDARYKKWMSTYKAVYVETHQMLDLLESDGLNNIRLYPNCRHKPQNLYMPRQNENSNLSCVFFSYIIPQKGVDLIIKAAKNLPDISFVFYGDIPGNYAPMFKKNIRLFRNIRYAGNFMGEPEDIYNELNRYDVLLFPTKYKSEGVPGILVEAKISGLAIIASNESHNSELIEHNVNGIILSENTTENLVNAIEDLDSNRKKLFELKTRSLESASDYFIEKYIDQITSNFLNQDDKRTIQKEKI